MSSPRGASVRELKNDDMGDAEEMKVTVQVGISSKSKKHLLSLKTDSTVGELRMGIAKAEGIDVSNEDELYRVTLIVKGRKLDKDDEILKGLVGAKSVVIAIVGKKAAKKKRHDPRALYTVNFKKKPFGIRIQSNKEQTDAFIINFENDFGRNSGARLGSKVVKINGVDVAGQKTEDIEQRIKNLPCNDLHPIKLTFKPKEDIPSEELENVEGLLPDRYENPADYSAEFDERPFGITLFAGTGGRNAFVVGFQGPKAPKLVKAGSMVVAINGSSVEDWNIVNIQQELGSCKLPAKLTLRAAQGLTEHQYPVSMAQPPKKAAPTPSAPVVEQKVDEEEDDDDLVPKPMEMDSAISKHETYSIVFLKRPLGFGIMSPLGVGAMVSSVQDPDLKKKGLFPGTPITAVGRTDVREMTLQDVARVMSSASLPMAINFSKNQYFKAGDKVMVQYKDKWWKTTIKKFDAGNRKLAVSYDDRPFRFKNSEIISDFTRIRKEGDIHAMSIRT